LIESTSLRSIESYSGTLKIVLMDNEDDLILTPEDLSFLKDVFAPARRYARRPLRQHDVQDNVAYMLNVFRTERTPRMKCALSLMLLVVFVFLTAGTAPVRKEPEIPAKRPVSEYVQPNVTYAIDAYDPWEPMNRRIYIFNAIFDNYVYLPVVSGYEFVLPVFVRKGITNFFNNLTEVTNLMNSLLQFKFVKAVNTFGRICINTTVGRGLIDVATINDGIPREDEDFGQTLRFCWPRPLPGTAHIGPIGPAGHRRPGGGHGCLQPDGPGIDRPDRPGQP
jgi:phospholipid-binding lipoprotein MlaA